MVTLRGPWEKDRISFYTLGLTFLIFDLELLLIFPFLFSIPLGTKYTFLSAEIFLILLGLDFFYELYNEILSRQIRNQIIPWFIIGLLSLLLILIKLIPGKGNK